MTSTQRIQIFEESQIGEARRHVAEITRRAGLDETSAGGAAIVISELSKNLLYHGGGGEILIREIPNAPTWSLDILVLDRGPGIANIAEALRDGFSTRGTAGTGLGSVGRLTSCFEIFSRPGKGTVIWARLGPGDFSEGRFQVGGVSVALLGEEACGDAWDVVPSATGLSLIVVDGLGHGVFAEEAAREAISVFRSRVGAAPSEMLENVHLALGKTRGAAGAVMEISLPKNELVGAGVGNISMRVLSEPGSRSLISENGTLGLKARRAHEGRLPWLPESSVLVAASDGLQTQWSLDDYPGLLAKHPNLIAGVLYRDFQRERDDTTVVVIKGR